MYDCYNHSNCDKVKIFYRYGTWICKSCVVWDFEIMLPAKNLYFRTVLHPGYLLSAFVFVNEVFFVALLPLFPLRSFQSLFRLLKHWLKVSASFWGCDVFYYVCVPLLGQKTLCCLRVFYERVNSFLALIAYGRSAIALQSLEMCLYS